MDNPEKLATLDTGNGTKTNKTKHTAQKIKKMSNSDLTKKPGVIQDHSEGKQFLPLIRQGKQFLSLIRQGKQFLSLIRQGKQFLPLIRQGKQFLPLIRNPPSYS
jgi:hypothetical protein